MINNVQKLSAQSHKKWADEKPKLDAAREQRAIYFIPDEGPDYGEIMNNARKLEKRRASAISCKVIKPASPNGSSWRRPYASDWCKIVTKRLNSSCSKQDHRHTITDSHRISTAKSEEKTHQDHIPDRGHVSMSHNNMTYKPIPKPKAMKILDAKAALDKEWENCKK